MVVFTLMQENNFQYKRKHLCRCRRRCARRRLYHSAPSRGSKFQRRSTSLSLTSVYHHHQYLYQFPINITNIIIINILNITEISSQHLNPDQVCKKVSENVCEEKVEQICTPARCDYNVIDQLSPIINWKP